MTSNTQKKPVSLRRKRIRRFRRDKLGILAAIIFLGICVIALLAPWVSPYSPTNIVSAPLQSPTALYWLGTDEIGRDILTRLIYGARISLAISLVATVIAVAVGVPWGLLSGYRGGLFDSVSMRITDGLLAFPEIILALSLVAVLGPSSLNLTLAIAIVNIPRFTRLIRGEVLTWRDREFVHAARAMGASDWFIIRRAIFPNTISILVVQFTLTFATAVLMEAALSFLGLGVQPPTPSWGGMLSIARNFISIDPLYSIVAGAAIFVSVLSLSLVGDALRDAMDPRSRK